MRADAHSWRWADYDLHAIIPKKRNRLQLASVNRWLSSFLCLGAVEMFLAKQHVTCFALPFRQSALVGQATLDPLVTISRVSEGLIALHLYQCLRL